MLFGAEENRALLLSLLNAVLRPSTPIVTAELLHAQPERSTVDDKSIALDLRIKLETGEQVDIEMQSQKLPAQRERALYYWSRLYAGQLLRGDQYIELLKCAIILIANFEELSTPRFHSVFYVCDTSSGQFLQDHLELHLVELPKLERSLDRNDEPALVKWAKFLSAKADEELEALAMEDPMLKQAKEALDRLSADPVARLRAEMREMALISERLHLAAARREGKVEGRAEGKAEVVREQLIAKFGELPPDIGARLSGATEGQLVEWSKRLLFATTLDGVFEAP